MTEETIWTVNIVFTESEGKTRADAILEGAPEQLHGWGRARRDPKDPDVPAIGEDVAAARALSDLAHQLLEQAARRIELFEHRHVEVHL